MQEYIHPEKPSKLALMFQATMHLLAVKKSVEKKMINAAFETIPASIPKSFYTQFNISHTEQAGRKIWTIYKHNTSSKTLIVFLHGGAYMANITHDHWMFVKQLVNETEATVIVPDYPLTPEFCCVDTYDFISRMYNKLLEGFADKNIVFIGDSAGGALALGFAQLLRDQQKQLPKHLVALSPWLDATMSNEAIDNIQKHDKLLTVKGLKAAAEMYAGGLPLSDFKISPRYGNFNELCSVSLFTGTHDILNADARLIFNQLKDSQFNIRYYEYPGMFHDWAIFTRLPESIDVINKLCVELKSM